MISGVPRLNGSIGGWCAQLRGTLRRETPTWNVDIRYGAGSLGRVAARRTPAGGVRGGSGAVRPSSPVNLEGNRT